MLSSRVNVCRSCAARWCGVADPPRQPARPCRSIPPPTTVLNIPSNAPLHGAINEIPPEAYLVPSCTDPRGPAQGERILR